MTEPSPQRAGYPAGENWPNNAPVLLPGMPGYRTRDGRSGLDMLDTQFEMAYMAGLFLRRLFTNTWHRPGIDPHPLITLSVGAALWLGFPGGVEACPGIFIVLLVGLVTGTIRYANRLAEEALINDEEEEEQEVDS